MPKRKGNFYNHTSRNVDFSDFVPARKMPPVRALDAREQKRQEELKNQKVISGVKKVTKELVKIVGSIKRELVGLGKLST